MHHFQKQFEDVVRTIGLCEGCPAINQAQAEITQLIADDFRQGASGEPEVTDERINGQSPQEFVSRVNQILGVRAETVAEAQRELRLRAFMTSLIKIQSLRRLVEQEGHCKGPITKEQRANLSFENPQQQQDLELLISKIEAIDPVLVNKVENVSPAGYYCEVENRRRARIIELFNPTEG